MLQVVRWPTGVLGGWEADWGRPVKLNPNRKKPKNELVLALLLPAAERNAAAMMIAEDADETAMMTGTVDGDKKIAGLDK
jgi:hypothetical protein